MPKSTLFLHWGPGAHAEVEKNLLPHLFPESDWSAYHFWNQPKASSFSELVGAAVNEASRLANKGKIRIVAHSSGGVVATEILKKIPNQIENLTLIGTNVYPEVAFVNLARRLGIRNEAYRAAEKQLTSETFWPLIGEIMQVPNFGEAYWSKNSASQKSRHTEESAKHAPLDLAVFQAILNDWLKNPRKNEQIAYSGDVSLMLGEDDPLVVIPDEITAWKATFPALRVKILPHCGHFIHFESDPASWRPAD